MPKDADHDAPASRNARYDYSLDDRTREIILRASLGTFIALTGIVCLIGLATRSYDKALISGTGAAVYLLLFAGIGRLGPRRIGVLTTFWYFALATGAMAAGRGVNDIAMVLFPAGMFLGALLVDRRYLLLVIASAVAIVAVVGQAKVSGLLASKPPSPASPAEVLVAVILLVVAGTLTILIERSLNDMFSERRRAEERVLDSKSQIEARSEALELVNTLANRLHHNLDIDAIANETVQVLARHSRPPLVAFYLVDDDGEHVHLVAERGFTDEERRLGARLPIEGSLSGIAIREQRLVQSDDIGTDRRGDPRMTEALGRRGITSALSIPLVFGGTSLGNLNLAYPEPRELSALDLDTFAAIGQAVSLAIANARHIADLEHQAFHDSLTSLPNRASLHREFASRLLRADGGAARMALAILDLRRFREINEALGHHVGDDLLVSTGARLSRQFGSSSVFRLGANEFAALLPAEDGVRDAATKAQDLLGVLRRPFAVGEMALELGACVGVALFPDHGRDSHQVLRSADVALHEAKHQGVSVMVYSESIDEHTPERLAMMSELTAAVQNGELTLHYQPQIRLGSERLAGFEALVRWAHPRLGLLPPSRFLPLAESSDVIHPLTYRVVETALEQLRSWTKDGHHVQMAINLSVRNLLDGSCAQRIEEIIRRVGVDAAMVEFELTETAVMTNPVTALEMLQRITATGARLAIDDFGTGYSSLTYLSRFPIKAIKIDRSFVSEMLRSPQSNAIVNSTVQLARSMDLEAIAEGVDDRATVDALDAMGCEFAQGFYFARPAPPEEIALHFLPDDGWQRDVAGD